MELTVTLGGTVFPLKRLAPSVTVPSEPPAQLIGPVTLADRSHTFYTSVDSFAGPMGQERFDMRSRVQGYRSGGLAASIEQGYLMLPPGISQEFADSYYGTTFVIFPSSVGVTHDIADRLGAGLPYATSSYRQYMAVGNAVWRSDSEEENFDDDATPRVFVPFASHIGSIAVQHWNVDQTTKGSRIWVAGASENTSHKLWFADNDPDPTVRTSNGISFDAATKEIRETGQLGSFGGGAGEYVRVTGSAYNDGEYTVASATADKLVVSESLNDESAGTSLTLMQSNWTQAAEEGEALGSGVGGLPGEYPDLIVAKADGTVYRLTGGTGAATYNMDVQTPGRTVFISYTANPSYNGIYMIKGGLFVNWIYHSTRSGQRGGGAVVEEVYPDLFGLIHGTFAKGTPWVTDGPNVWRLMEGDYQWVGLPPNLDVAEIRYLYASGGWLYAVVIDENGEGDPDTTTTILGLPLEEFAIGRGPQIDLPEPWTPRGPYQPLPRTATPVAPSLPEAPWTLWQEVATISNQTGLGIHVGPQSVQSGKLRHGWISTYRNVRVPATGGATDITFLTGPYRITRTAGGLSGFEVGDVIGVSGSSNNDSDYITVSTVTSDTELATGTVVAEAAGQSITLTAERSYIHSFDLPTPAGVVAPGGKFQQNAYRVMPTFDGGMPDVEGTFFGVVVVYDFPTGIDADSYLKVEYKADAGSWTQIGSNFAPGADERGATTLSLTTPVSFKVLDIRITMDRDTDDETKSPRIFAIAYIWKKREALRYTFTLLVDAEQYCSTGKEYDDLLADVATLHDTVTPLTLAIGWWTTTYSVRIQRITTAPDQADRLDGKYDLIIECEEVL